MNHNKIYVVVRMSNNKMNLIYQVNVLNNLQGYSKQTNVQKTQFLKTIIEQKKNVSTLGASSKKIEYHVNDLRLVYKILNMNFVKRKGS